MPLRLVAAGDGNVVDQATAVEYEASLHILNCGTIVE